MFEETETHIFLVFFTIYLLSIIINLLICEETLTHIFLVFFAIIFVNINTMAEDNIITMEDVEKMNLQALKVHLEKFGLSTSCEGAGRGGSKKLLISRLKSFLFDVPPNPEDSIGATPLPAVEDSDWDVIKVKYGPVYKRIPKASRLQACFAFTKILNDVISLNDEKSWQNLANFARCAIGSSKRGGKKKRSQATIPYLKQALELTL